MHASNAETIYFAGSGDWTKARLITVSGSARPMSHIDKQDRGMRNRIVYRILIFSQHEVVLAHGDDEYDGGDSFKAVNPFLAFRPLAADVEHPDSANSIASIVSVRVKSGWHIIISQPSLTAHLCDDYSLLFSNMDRNRDKLGYYLRNYFVRRGENSTPLFVPFLHFILLKADTFIKLDDYATGPR